ncbi:MAG: hypothetical protein V2I43_00910, partial [Parvularcula sp.]|nr:hypothetical protein [Parvularcula sp.]
PAIIFHGTADRTVAPANAEQIAGKLEGVERRRVQEGGRQIEVTFGRSGDGHQVEIWAIDGAGHAWSGGHRGGTYTDPTGPSATSEMMRFFRRQG